MGYDDLLAVMALQDGVANRRQCRAHGLSDADVRRKVRRREWARVHPLCAWSVLRGGETPGSDRDDSSPIHVAIDVDRKCRTPETVVVHRVTDLAAKTRWNLCPPQVRVEEAVIDIVTRATDDLGAISVIADVVGARRTTADRLLRVLESRSRVPRRAFLASVLSDVSAGACSALEHRYLAQVERAHGLPSAQRQLRASSRGPIYRDVVYEALGLVVELDGRLAQDRVRDRDRDLERDLDAALDGLLTLRLGWGQVVGRPCDTAAKLVRVLVLRGWQGRPRRCRHCHGGDS